MLKSMLKCVPVGQIAELVSVAACQLDTSMTIQNAAFAISRRTTRKEVVNIVGEKGSGKTTFAEALIRQLVCSGFTSNSDVLYVQLDEYDSEDSLWNTAVELAKIKGDRSSMTVLASNLTKREEKLNAVIKVLNNYKVVFFDNFLVNQNESFYQAILTVMKKSYTIDICVSDMETMMKMEGVTSIHIKVNGLSQAALLRSLEHLTVTDDMRETIELGCKALHCNPKAVQLYVMSCLEFGAYHISEETAQKSNPVGCVLETTLQFLSKAELSALHQLCELRQPLPITWHQVGGQVRLVKLGLVQYDSVGTTDQQALGMVSVCNSIQQSLKGQMSIQDVHPKKIADDKQFNVFYLWMALLSYELQGLVTDAKENKWPFVPEKWQYVAVAVTKESYNVKDLLMQKNTYFQHLKQFDILQECLHHATLRKDYQDMAAIIFVLDRFVYWKGGSKMLLSLVDTITQEEPSLRPVAPQLVIRKARLLRTSGDLQGAEKVLDRILKNNQSLDAWQYKESHDHQLVKAVCVQIKGEIQTSLGQWLTAATHLLESINLFKTLPKIDKKGVASSLGLMVNTLQNMSMDDYQTIATKYSLKSPHPFLLAYDFACEGASYSKFTPLFYARSKRRAGEMMLEYAKLIPAENQAQFLDKSLAELKESLKAHESLESLSSREQYYEFIHALYKIGCVYELYGQLKIAKNLKKLVMLLYEHYSTHQIVIIHDSVSQSHVNNALSILELRLLGRNEIAFDVTITPNYPQHQAPMKNSTGPDDSESVDASIDRCATTLEIVDINQSPTVDRQKTTVASDENHLSNATVVNIQSYPNTSSVHECELSRYHYDPVKPLWKRSSTLVYIGEQLDLSKDKKGKQRNPFMVEYLNQDEPMGKYVGKRYKKLLRPQQYVEDVSCQMTARYYVGLFNQELYQKGVEVSQIQFLPVVMLQLLDDNGMKTDAVYNVEPYIDGDFQKITNNWKFVEKEGEGSKLVLAFSHYTFEKSGHKMVIVDHQGWSTSDHLSTTFLTDPQIHTIGQEQFGTGNLGKPGIDAFWSTMHTECNEICKQLGLERPITIK